MQSVKIQDIIVKDRARKDLGDLSALKHSIEAQGLLNPIILNQDYVLCAGERRLRSHQELGKTEILARIIPDLSPEDSLVIEWIENEGRKDFTWAEDAQLKRHIHESFKAKNSKWGYRDTASYLGISIGGFSMDLELAKALDYFPDLASCATKGKARETYKKILSQAEAIEAEENYSSEDQATLDHIFSARTNFKPVPIATEEDIKAREEKAKEKAKDAESSSSSSSNLPKFSYKICDFKLLLDQLPDNSVGFAELDPPYAIKFNEVYGQTSKIQTAKNFSDWTEEEYFSNITHLLNQLYSKLQDPTWVLCWCAREFAYDTNKIALKAGFKVQQPGVWLKPGGSSNNLKAVMCSNYETFLLLRKGTATFNSASFNAAIYHNNESHYEKIHPTQKPRELYKIFFSALARPSTIFYSPFAGSGNSMLTALDFSMIPVGSDSDQKYYYHFIKKLRESYGS